MQIVEATFSVSDAIWSKIASGDYERVGGVVRDSQSKEIVAWLRETGTPQVLSNGLATIGAASSILSLGV